MKKTILFFCGILFFSYCLPAQNDSIFPDLKYKTWVKPYKARTRQVLFKLGDTSVIISNTPRKSDYHTGQYTLKEMGIKDITEIVYEKRGRGVAIGIGAVTGAALGTGIAVVYGNSLADNMDPARYIFGGFLLTTIPVIVSTGLGIVIGAISAGKKVKIPIDGNLKSYYLNQARLSKVTVSQDLSWWPRDYDGNVYSAFFWQGKAWTMENLRVTRYSNGEWIPNVNEPERWITFRAGAMCQYMSKSQTVKDQGLLYNHDAVRDPRGICPEGWHVGTKEEWETILPFLEENVAGNDTLFILSGSVFALPAGYRDQGGRFSKDQSYMQWWTSSPVDSSKSEAVFLWKNRDRSSITTTDEKSGFSVRCVKDD